MNATVDIQNTTAKYLIPYLYFHLIFVGLSALVTENDVTAALVATFIFATVPMISWKITGVSVLTRFLTAVGFMLIIATLVYSFRGHPWQLDIHMYFFAGLAMLIGFADWRVYLVATVVVAVHHLSLNFILPYWVFPEGADFFRVVLHAVVVIVETGVLIFGTIKMVQSLNIAEKATLEAENAQQEALCAIENQRLAEEKAQHEKEEELNNIASDFEQEVGTIVSTVKEAADTLQHLAVDMSSAAEQVGENAENASNASLNITGNVDAVAASSEELSASVDEISRQVNSSSEEAINAANMSSKATENVKSLSDRVAEISEVVNLISDIANQTNLLALNATIESARAGEAGKGFAVVASEVKNLASQTAGATEQIEKQINAVVGATDDTVKGIETINSAISRVQETSSAISAAIEEQGAATREIAGSAAQTAEDVALVSSTVSEVKDGAQSNVNRSQQVLSASADLQKQAEALTNKLVTFVEKLKTG